MKREVMETKQELPERIWLHQVDDEITWCADKIGDDDVGYVREDHLSEIKAALDDANCLINDLYEDCTF